MLWESSAGAAILEPGTTTPEAAMGRAATLAATGAAMKRAATEWVLLLTVRQVDKGDPRHLRNEATIAASDMTSRERWRRNEAGIVAGNIPTERALLPTARQKSRTAMVSTGAMKRALLPAARQVEDGGAAIKRPHVRCQHGVPGLADSQVLAGVVLRHGGAGAPNRGVRPGQHPAGLLLGVPLLLPVALEAGGYLRTLALLLLAPFILLLYTAID
ncbi:hypothetical protein ZWY2020_045214 [Hordeum vulgare]|nr:hypothetical protein ZWY2020_045214 [Hordeum vulgare]